MPSTASVSLPTMDIRLWFKCSSIILVFKRVTLPLTEKRSEFHKINSIVAIICHYYLPRGTIQCSKNRFKVSLSSWDMQKNTCTIRESNPGQMLGRHLCYHYTNGASVTIWGRIKIYDHSFWWLSHHSYLTTFLTRFLVLVQTTTLLPHSFMYKSLITFSLSLALIIVSKSVSRLIADKLYFIFKFSCKFLSSALLVVVPFSIWYKKYAWVVKFWLLMTNLKFTLLVQWLPCTIQHNIWTFFSHCTFAFIPPCSSILNIQRTLWLLVRANVLIPVHKWSW